MNKIKQKQLMKLIKQEIKLKQMISDNLKQQRELKLEIYNEENTWNTWNTVTWNTGPLAC